MNAAFFDAVRPMFGGSLTQDQVDGINAIIRGWYAHGDGDNRKLAYLLATAKLETAGTMQPIHEYGKRPYFNKYEPTTKKGKVLGNTLKGDGYKFRGRGFVQITGRANYVKAGRKLGVDFTADPDRALEPTLAAAILVMGCMEGWFTTRKLGDYIGTPPDFVNARRVVNGTDRADDIADDAVRFAQALATTVHKPSPLPTPPKPAPAAPVPSERKGRGIAAAIIVAVLALATHVSGAWQWVMSLFG